MPETGGSRVKNLWFGKIRFLENLHQQKAPYTPANLPFYHIGGQTPC